MGSGKILLQADPYEKQESSAEIQS